MYDIYYIICNMTSYIHEINNKSGPTHGDHESKGCITYIF